MEWILQKARSFWACLQVLSSFEQILFMVLSVAVLFIFYWLAKNSKMIINRLREWLIRYQSFRYRTLWEPVTLSIITIGIFICFFGDKLLTEMDQDTLRNLILLTAGVVGWYFLYQRAKTADQSKKATEQSAEATRKNAETAEKGLTIERFTRAIEQIAHEKPSVRLGGIRSLEQIANTHEEERTKIMQILSTRIRELAPLEDTRSDKELYDRPDIKSAIEVLAKIAEPFGEDKKEFCQLYRTNLCNLHFSKINLSYFNFRYTNFRRASFVNADFDETQLDRVNVSSTFFTRITGTVAPPIANLKSFYLREHPPIDLTNLPRGLNPEERETLPEDD